MSVLTFDSPGTKFRSRCYTVLFNQKNGIVVDDILFSVAPFIRFKKGVCVCVCVRECPRSIGIFWHSVSEPLLVGSFSAGRTALSLID